MDVASPPHPRSSTPPSYQQRAAMSSPSSLLPSPSEFLSKTGCGTLRSGSRAAEGPKVAFTGHATAARLIKSARLSLDTDDSTVEEKPKRRRKKLAEVDVNANAPKKPSKRFTKESKDGEVTAKKSRKRKETTDTAISKPNPPPSVSDPITASISSSIPQDNAPGPPKPKPKPRKPRVPKENPESQTKLKAGRITKPGAKSKTGKAKSNDIEFIQEYNFESNTTGVKSTHFDVDTGTISHTAESAENSMDIEASRTSIRDVILPEIAINAEKVVVITKATPAKETDAIEEPLSLEPALKRRTDWTPTKNTEVIVLDVSPDIRQVGDSPEVVDKPTFTSVLASYTYTNTTQAITTESVAQQVSGEGLTKRRRIELVDLPAMHINPVGVTKALKKKATTITDLVTGQYKPAGQDDIDSDVTSDILGPRTGDVPAPANPTKVPFAMKPPRKRAPREKLPTKTNSKVKKPAKEPKPQPKLVADKLLSPESALQRLHRQEVLFGTSSQLARDESPPLIRRIQQAIRESEAEAEASATISHQAADASHSLHGKKFSTFTTRRALWSAAARDDENKLLEEDVTSWHPAVLPRDERHSLMEKEGSFVDIEAMHSDENPLSEEKQDSGFYSIEEFADGKDCPPHPDCKPSNNVVSTSITQLDSPVDGPTKADSSFVDIENFEQHDVTEDPRSTATASVTYDHMKLLKDREPLASNMSPTKEPVKKRGRPPKSAKTSPAKQIKALNASPKKKSKFSTQKSSLLPPSTPQKKPKNKKFADIDEIEDSEAESPLTPTPPRRVLGRNSVTPLQLRPSEQATSDLSSDETKHQQEIANKLKAEKIAAARVAKAEAANLLEIAVREDLFPKITATVKGAPRTTDPSKPSWYERILMYDPIVLEDLTAWLNMQGVRSALTLKRKAKGKKPANEGLAGDNDETEVVEKELETKMVQKWCEENSICCLNREGKKHW